jgi:LmbE family N-acetylglucosaminyl deacetylase
MAIIAVVAAHPDDETLGCGGTLLKHKHSGDSIHWIIATEMRAEDGYTPGDLQRRDQEIKQVGALYGFDGVHRMNLPTTRVDEVPLGQLVARSAKQISAIEPHVLYLPFKSDAHSDHRILFDAFYSCTKIFRHPNIRKVMMMETLSETEFAPALPADSFIPNVFVDISSFIEKKIAIMKNYEGELKSPPFPRSETSIKALAAVRGSASGCAYAESFMLLKEIW